MSSLRAAVIRRFVTRSGFAFASALMLVVSSGCDAIDPNALFPEQDEAAEDSQANTPDATDLPAWATFDLSTTTSDLDITEPWVVYAEDDSGSPDADSYQVGQIAPPGMFTFDVTSTPPAAMLQPFDVAWYANADENQTREDGLTYSNSRPNILLFPLFDMPARPESSDTPSGLTVQIPIDDPYQPWIAVVYSDRATDVTGTYDVKTDGVTDIEHTFNLRLTQGYNLVKVVADDDVNIDSIRFSSDLGTSTLSWVLDGPSS
jgi:hypothetical protein